ncbi:MAG: helix-turn-helix transcriptional regulator [Planctomycetes bacterium]|nr:helix-turn-helix transcriptional regulator [Planctomycetota bacterium]
MSNDARRNGQLMRNIGRNIKQLREKTGLSAQEFSGKVGITRVQSLYEYEKGLRSPKINVLYNMATVFGVSIDSMFDTENYVQVVSNKEEIMGGVYDWEQEIRESTSGVVGLRKVALPFFSRIHRTELTNVILENQRGNPKVDEYVRDWRKRVELFESGGYVSKEICYMPTIIDFGYGKGISTEIPLEERISQLERIVGRINKYRDNLEIRVLERPAKISFVVYGKKLIFNGETSYFVSKNPGLVRAFNREFTVLWEDCKLRTRAQVSEFLGALIKEISVSLADRRRVHS